MARQIDETGHGQRLAHGGVTEMQVTLTCILPCGCPYTCAVQPGDETPLSEWLTGSAATLLDDRLKRVLDRHVCQPKDGAI